MVGRIFKVSVHVLLISITITTCSTGFPVRYEGYPVQYTDILSMLALAEDVRYSLSIMVVSTQVHWQSTYMYNGRKKGY